MSSVLYEPHERPPYPLAFGLSFQRAMIMGAHGDGVTVRVDGAD